MDHVTERHKMLERDIEKYLVKEVAKLGGKAYKFSSPNNRAVPDRICFFPKGKINLVECKAPGKLPTPLQNHVIKFLRSLGFDIFVIDTKEKVDLYLDLMPEGHHE